MKARLLFWHKARLQNRYVLEDFKKLVLEYLEVKI